MKKTIFAGFGGQGVLMMGYAFAVASMLDGKHVTYLPSYGAEMRGGTANCTVAVSDEEIFSPVASSPDYGVIMNKPSMIRYESAMKPGGTILLNSNLVDMEPSRRDIEIFKVPANDLVRKAGSDQTANMIMLGAFTTLTGMTSLDSILRGLEEITRGKKSALMKLNRASLDLGAEYVKNSLAQGG
ncbi:MAG TPA: 2-oxoacid:acceptor oxidoreductase family protein [Syntrophales bacterium]|nr:2-oxoacid:acceptor oxidoreductase family protein [Syntrophales bacterium]